MIQTFMLLHRKQKQTTKNSSKRKEPRQELTENKDTTPTLCWPIQCAKICCLYQIQYAVVHFKAKNKMDFTSISWAFGFTNVLIWTKKSIVIPSLFLPPFNKRCKLETPRQHKLHTYLSANHMQHVLQAKCFNSECVVRVSLS